ncbi:MAG: orotidine-5'-phosphate decarboxylase [Candidatus Omnitrophica bacterium]|nr:orotidine-5'-phosphate decarboxylase [Candidatus Omnitrophota bacterium]
MTRRKTRLIVALDVATLEQAESVVRELSPLADYFKIGSQLFTAGGPPVVEMVRRYQADVFLDLKFHDIPNTVAQAALSALRLGVSMLNVHAAGGALMLREVAGAVAAASAGASHRPLVLGVTVLTSMDRPQLNSLGIMRSVKNQVLALARLCRACGLDGVVCSGQEIEVLRRVVGEEFVLVVPGVRPAEGNADDQKRIVTPAAAARRGADYIVVGRPILAAADRQKAAQAILAELSKDLRCTQ